MESYLRYRRNINIKYVQLQNRTHNYVTFFWFQQCDIFHDQFICNPEYENSFLGMVRTITVLYVDFCLFLYLFISFIIPCSSILVEWS